MRSEEDMFGDGHGWGGDGHKFSVPKFHAQTFPCLRSILGKKS